MQSAEYTGRIAAILLAYRQRLGGRTMTPEEALNEIGDLVSQYMDSLDEPIPFWPTDKAVEARVCK